MALRSQNRPVESTTMQIVEEVAAVRGVEPSRLDPPLGSVIDPDALDAIVGTRPQSDVSVQFTYADCLVSVSERGVAVDDTTGGEV